MSAPLLRRTPAVAALLVTLAGLVRPEDAAGQRVPAGTRLEFGTGAVGWQGTAGLRAGVALAGEWAGTAGRWAVASQMNGLLLDGALARGQWRATALAPWRAGPFRVSAAADLETLNQPGVPGGRRGALQFGLASAEQLRQGLQLRALSGLATHGGIDRIYGQVQTGGWLAVGSVRLSLGWTGTVATTPVPVEPTSTPGAMTGGTQGGGGATFEPLRFSDASVGMDWQRGALEVSLLGARRFGYRAGVPNWGRAGVALQVGGGTALTAAIANVPSDPLLHQAARREFGVGVRLAAPRVGARADLLRGLAYDVRVRQGTLLLRAAGASRVEVQGSFTAWEAQPLARLRDGEWGLAFPLPPGLHRFVVRVDGGPWQVPDGAATATDEFLGSSAVVVVPDPAVP